MSESTEEPLLYPPDFAEMKQEREKYLKLLRATRDPDVPSSQSHSYSIQSTYGPKRVEFVAPAHSGMVEVAFVDKNDKQRSAFFRGDEFAYMASAEGW